MLDFVPNWEEEENKIKTSKRPIKPTCISREVGAREARSGALASEQT